MIERHTLKNGVRVLAQKRPESLVTSIVILVKTGSRNETPEIHGISHFLEHMTFKGTKRRPTTEAVAKEIDSMGGYSNAFTGSEYTGFIIKTQYKDFENGMDILSDMAFNSLIREKDLEKEKGTVLEEINRRNDDPETLKWELFESVLYENKFLAQDVLGSEKAIESMTANKMRKYYRKYYKAGNVVVSAVGNLPTNYLEIIEMKLNGISKGAENYLSSAKKEDFKKKILLERRKTNQTHIAVGVNYFPKKSPKIYPGRLLAVVLGGNTSSRLWMKIREELGFAYNIGAYTEPGFSDGMFCAAGGLNTNNIYSALSIIREEMLAIAADITKEEIENAKKFLEGFFSLREESSLDTAQHNAMDELLGSEAVITQERIKMYQSITLDQVIGVAEEILKPQNLKLAVIGPFKDEQKFAKILEG